MKRISLLLLPFIIFSCQAQKNPNDLILQDEVKNYTLESVADGIQNPWGMAWLPDGTLLVTEKSGILYQIKNGVKTEIKNVPAVYNRGQGGLLDIAVHPDYAKNGWIYITYASTEGEGEGGNTKLIRTKLLDGALTQIESLYKCGPNTTKGQHFGSRIVFDKAGYLYFSAGERGEHFVNPQDITRDNGKIYRLNDDGSIPKDNPFVGQKNAKEAIYTYGNRNPQGLAINPITGDVWEHEHGPKGGDEINIIKKAANYGWAVVTYGIDYDGTSISSETVKPGIEDPIYYWVPSIAPSGMAFVTSDRYPDWKGHLLVGSLKFQYLELVKLNGNEIIGRQKIATDVGRLRNVAQGPDGYIYIGVEGKGILKIIPN
ncbi:PQQ-dependent sugar dehydrogenase [Flavobacterium degerlachei]|jgi:glucose/arabinose dehydrogenase|uniref:Glucose/arabinose dehydrogenase, beta-propeller fold n=1 Tax=Flavobacterium degerlachei TaxID=229203 RepID=A0A1H2R4I6_9FLAO|nr:PQQ-dependent sugar dehydrogenase [Flavobacterium degerlachei]SDW14245.1 Glucose/arabinose dehydrogenase, beta-propeller fold [Flavobacterium degerlachei]